MPVDAFAARVRAARGHRHAWTLSSTMTDLHVDSNGEVAHAPFDPAGPGTIKWLHHRLMKVHCEVEPTAERLLESLDGTAVRIRDNGLGFDLTRMGSQSDDSGKFGKWVDPAVEVLAFFGLAILPVTRHRHRCKPVEDLSVIRHSARMAPAAEPRKRAPVHLAGVGFPPSIMPASTRSSTSGIEAGRTGRESVCMPRGEVSGTSPRLRRTPRGGSERSRFDGRSRSRHLGDRALRILSKTVRSHPLRRRVE